MGLSVKENALIPDRFTPSVGVSNLVFVDDGTSLIIKDSFISRQHVERQTSHHRRFRPDCHPKHQRILESLSQQDWVTGLLSLGGEIEIVGSQFSDAFSTYTFLSDDAYISNSVFSGNFDDFSPLIRAAGTNLRLNNVTILADTIPEPPSRPQHPRIFG